MLLKFELIPLYVLKVRAFLVDADLSPSSINGF